MISATVAPCGTNDEVAEEKNIFKS